MIMKLYDAIRSGDIDQMLLILEANPELANQVDPRGFTPLILATYLEHIRIAEVLIDSGADVNARDGAGNTALMGVCFKGHPEIVRMLISKGADTSIKNNNGETALDFATRAGNNEIEKMLT